MNTRKQKVAAGILSLGIGVAALVAAPLVAEAGLQRLTCSVVTARGGMTHGECHMATAALLSAPLIKQSMPLDCESAALAVALQARGFDISQGWVFDQLPKDPRVAIVTGAHPVTWGDPYVDFVGNVYGAESRYTGYGVYYPPIVAAAERAGATADGHTGWTTSEIEAEVRAGNPVVVWVNFNFAYTATGRWNARDGRSIPYTTKEHAVTVVGFNTLTGTVTVVDVGVGLHRSISTAAFAAAIATFGGMAVAIS